MVAGVNQAVDEVVRMMATQRYRMAMIAQAGAST